MYHDCLEGEGGACTRFVYYPGTRRVIPGPVTTRSGAGKTYYLPGIWTLPGYPGAR